MDTIPFAVGTFTIKDFVASLFPLIYFFKMHIAVIGNSFTHCSYSCICATRLDIGYVVDLSTALPCTCTTTMFADL